MQEALTRNKPTLTYNNTNLTYMALATTRSSFFWIPIMMGLTSSPQTMTNNNTWIYWTQVYEIHKQALKFPYDLNHFLCASTLLFFYFVLTTSPNLHVVEENEKRKTSCQKHSSLEQGITKNSKTKNKNMFL